MYYLNPDKCDIFGIELIQSPFRVLCECYTVLCNQALGA